MAHFFDLIADRISAAWDDEDPVNDSLLSDEEAAGIIDNPKFVDQSTDDSVHSLLVWPRRSDVYIGGVDAYLTEEHDIKPQFKADFGQSCQQAGGPCYVTQDVMLDPKLKGRGLGREMYERTIKLIAGNGGGVLAPHDVELGGHTSDDARRVWDGMYRRHPHVGPFVVIKAE